MSCAALQTTSIRGVVFRCNIRAGHSFLAVSLPSSPSVAPSLMVDHHRVKGDGTPEEHAEMVMVVIRFGGANWTKTDDVSAATRSKIRTDIRRLCKLGNELLFTGFFSDYEASSTSVECRRFFVDYHLDSDAEESSVRVCDALKWDCSACQSMRERYFPSPSRPKKPQLNRKKLNDDEEKGLKSARHHGGGLGKRMQGEILADFFLWVVLSSREEKPVTSQRDNISTSQQEYKNHLFPQREIPLTSGLAAKYNGITMADPRLVSSISSGAVKPDVMEAAKSLNVIDAAGGAGHVSLALALREVHSTVVDPRTNVGLLPKRDRKVLKRSQKRPFSTHRAWFGSRPSGIDAQFREGAKANSDKDAFTLMDGTIVSDPTALPICSACDETGLLSACNGIVALHPDEATGDIVDCAIARRIPFVVVPCCVFSRLFPDRLKPSDGKTLVSTYLDLIDWLVAKHPSIRVTRLPFDGANLAVWSTFPRPCCDVGLQE